MKKTLLSLASIVFLLFSCGTSKSSDRDKRREQIRVNAEKKRQELTPLIGVYHGMLSSPGYNDSTNDQNSTLEVTIKDVPESEDGEVDAVMVPTLSGFVRLNYRMGEDNGTEEHYQSVTFQIVEGEYDPSGQSLNLVSNNETYGDLILALTKDDQEDLTGDWTASALAVSGTTYLRNNATTGLTLTDFPLTNVNGSYQGNMWWPSGEAQHGFVTLATNFTPPDNFSLSGSVRQTFGAKDSLEYMTHTFESVNWNPVTGAITLTTGGSGLTFAGTLSGTGLVGSWQSKSVGPMGTFAFSTDEKSNLSEDLYINAIAGTYRGTLKNENSQANMPERVLMTITSAESHVAPGDLLFNGNVRFYLGDFDSIEYTEVAFDSVDVNLFRGLVSIQIKGNYAFTINLNRHQGGLTGQLIHASLGRIGPLEFSRFSEEEQ